MLKKILSVLAVTFFVCNAAGITTLAMPPAYVSNVTISGDAERHMTVGEKITLEAVATPEGVNYAYMDWLADKSGVVNITGVDSTSQISPPSASVEITALVAGTVTITAYADVFPNPDVYAESVSVTIIVSEAPMPPYVSSVTISGEAEQHMTICEKITLEAVATPEGVNYAYMDWLADKSGVVNITGADSTVQISPPSVSVEITALAAGTVTITAYADVFPNPDVYAKSASVTIIVSEAPAPPDENFRYILKSDAAEIKHGKESGVSFTVQPQSGNPLKISEEIKAIVPLFHKNPYPLNAKTELGLYVYGLPEGVTAVVMRNTETQELTIMLSGKATGNVAEGTHPSIAYLYSTAQNPPTEGQKIGDFDEKTIYALMGEISGITFQTHKSGTDSGSRRRSPGIRIALPSSSDSAKFKTNAAQVAYLTTYADGDFKPGQAITRDETLIALDKLVETSVTGDALERFKAAGVIQGFEDGEFHGENGLSRAELVKILALILQIKPYDGDDKFIDIAGHWARCYINSFSYLGYIKAMATTFSRLIRKLPALNSP